MESEQRERLNQQIKRLQTEIDSFLQGYDPNREKDVLLLFSYRYILEEFAERTAQHFTEQKEMVDSLVESLSLDSLVWYATFFDYDVYFANFLEGFDKWWNNEITSSQLINMAVCLERIFDGFHELSKCIGSDFVTDQDWEFLYEQRYKLTEYLVWNYMFDQYDELYNFDNKIPDEKPKDKIWL